MVPTNTIVGGETGSAATGIVGVTDTGSFDIATQILKTAEGGDASDTIVGGGSKRHN